MIDKINYNEAMSALRAGKKVKRLGWPVYLRLDVNDKIVVVSDSDLIEWTPLTNDMIANDWYIVGGHTNG